MHLQSGHRRGNEQGGGGRGVNGTELCKVIYQANISNKLVKYYVIKLSAHAQQESDMHNAHCQGRVGAGGRGWPGLAYVSQCQHKFHSTFDMTTIKSSGQPNRIRFHSHSHARTHTHSHIHAHTDIHLHIHITLTSHSVSLSLSLPLTISSLAPFKSKLREQTKTGKLSAPNSTS